MTRGVQLSQLSELDRGHLGLPPDTLQGGLDLATQNYFPELDPNTLAVAREVRTTLEDVFELLTQALPTRRT
jgi:hypothetical protein